ncbi:MAG: hypothetical protein AB1730_03525 [Myxococcota bacterium]|jgi:hypothetical protein
MRPAAAIVALLTLSACEKPAAATPEAAYNAFAVALRRGDTKAAYAALSKSTRALVEARSKTLSEASQGMVKDEPALMLFQSGTRPGPLGEVKVVEQSADRAVLEVSGTRVTMVKEDGGRWVVDLSDLYATKAGAP